MFDYIHKIAFEESLWGVPDGAGMLALAQRLSAGDRLVYVARDDARMMAMRDALAMQSPDVPLRLFPAWDCLPFDRLSPQGGLVGHRVETLAWLSDLGVHQADGDAGEVVGGAAILTTVNAVLQRVPPADYFTDRSMQLRAGDTTGPARLAEFLAIQGYPVSYTHLTLPTICSV